VNASNIIFVLDTELAAILVFDPFGQFVSQFSCPAASNVASYDAYLYASLWSQYIAVYNGAGECMGNFWGSQSSTRACTDIAIDSNTHRLYCITGDTQLTVWDISAAMGKPIGVIDMPSGTGNGQFGKVAGVAVDAGSGAIFLTDSVNERFVILQPTISLNGNVGQQDVIAAVNTSFVGTKIVTYSPLNYVLDLAIAHPDNHSVSLWRVVLQCSSGGDGGGDEDDWDVQLSWSLGLGLGLPLFIGCIITFFLLTTALNVYKNEHF